MFSFLQKINPKKSHEHKEKSNSHLTDQALFGSIDLTDKNGPRRTNLGYFTTGRFHDKKKPSSNLGTPKFSSSQTLTQLNPHYLYC